MLFIETSCKTIQFFAPVLGDGNSIICALDGYPRFGGAIVYGHEMFQQFDCPIACRNSNDRAQDADPANDGLVRDRNNI